MVEFNTREYEFSTGHRPRGFGQWAFEVNGLPGLLWTPTAMSYGEAKKWVRTQVNAHVEVKVCP